MPFRSIRRGLSRGRTTWRRRLTAATLTFLLTTSIVVAVPFTAGIAEADPASDAITDGLGQVSDALKGLDGLDELADLIPFSDILPTGGDGLDLVDALTEFLETRLAGLTNAAAVEAALNVTAVSLGGGIVADSTATVTTVGSTHTVSFTDLRLSRSGHIAELSPCLGHT